MIKFQQSSHILTVSGAECITYIPSIWSTKSAAVRYGDNKKDAYANEDTEDNPDVGAEKVGAYHGSRYDQEGHGQDQPLRVLAGRGLLNAGGVAVDVQV